jgi:hypothetical protein
MHLNFIEIGDMKMTTLKLLVIPFLIAISGAVQAQPVGEKDARSVDPRNANSCSIEELNKLPPERRYCEMFIVMDQTDFKAIALGSKAFGQILEWGELAPGKVIFSAVLSVRQIAEASIDKRVLVMLPNVHCINGKCDPGTGSFTVHN